MTRVAICICTYRRPQGLGRLLQSVSEQRFEGDPPEIRLVVVDNDAERSARPVVERWEEKLTWPIHDVVEPRRGIPVARNRALREVAGWADVVAFVDDDEWAEAGWLSALLDGLERYRADVVTGPRLPVYPEGVPDWLARARIYPERRWPTGREVDIAYTHNVAFRIDLLEELDSWFDEELVGSGGTDTDFFHRVRELGKKFVWVDDALVFERLAADRARARWLVSRFLRYGTTAGTLQRRRASSVTRSAKRVGAALGRAMASPLRLAAFPYEGRGALVHMAADCAFTVGFLLGWAGWTVDAYGPRPRSETSGAAAEGVGAAESGDTSS